MIRVAVYILSGGQSRRFGSDKARANFRGRPLLNHAAAMLEPVASQLTVVADVAGKYDDLGLRTIADHSPGLGPLAGLQTALVDLPQEDDWLLLCSCDALVIRPAWLDTLLQARDEQHSAVAFCADHWQPMPGLYRRCARSTVDACLETENRSMNGLLNRLAAKAVELPVDWPKQWQANTPGELARFSFGLTKKEGDSQN